MHLLKKILPVLIALIFISGKTQAQDSAGNALQWQVSSKKLSEKKYELSFAATPIRGWQVYLPNQGDSSFKTTEIRFADSSIMQDGAFTVSGDEQLIKVPALDNALMKVHTNAFVWKVIIVFRQTVPANLQGNLFYTYGKTGEFNPSTQYDFSVALAGGVQSTARIRIPAADINHPLTDCGDDSTKSKNILTIFFLGMLGGLIALLTPCVFPMIPVTVSFFTKKSGNRKKAVSNAILYGFFIFLIYVLLTLPFHIAGKAINPEIFNNISTNIWLNIIFFIIFIVFAVSFFGYYEIGLPSSFANRAHKQSGIGNISGIFFMSATLAMVSFSCTGPILGTLLVGVASQGAWPLTAGAAGFGLALGLPFALFALFPRWLHSMPKSGGWMTDLKVVLGFMEIALAVKFLSNADLVKQWGILKREIFIGLWVLVSLLIVLYLLGLIKFPHSSKKIKFSVYRIAVIILFSGITVYLFPGVTNTPKANLRLISGFPPPMCYSVYKNPVNCKKGFRPLDDYESAMAIAKKENKPLLIDFTGWACINCRKMEETVWTDPLVDSLMHHAFVVVSLYVDERRNLPLQDQMIYTTISGHPKNLVTVGDKWATFQSENFGAASQPQYIMLNNKERLLARPKYYPTTPGEFAEWLQCGLHAFHTDSP
jgi:cytochrome c biogenesis protein CcdA/thioredoxin-related protein